MFREGNAVHQPRCRSLGTQTTLMVFPEQFDFGDEVVVFGDDLGVRVPAHHTVRRLVRWSWHAGRKCREGA